MARSKEMDQDTSSQPVDIYGRSTDFIKTREIDISDIAPNPHQPRKSMSEERLNELTNSIHTLGLINPITVMEAPEGGGQRYVLLAGQRRLEAFRRLGKSKITAVVKSRNQGIEIAIAENVERENLNPIDEAEAYQRAMEEKNFTQEELAARLGKSRQSVQDILSLNKLPEHMREAARRSDRLTKSALVELIRTRDDLERDKLWALYQSGNVSVRAAKKQKEGGEVKTTQTPGRKAIFLARSLVNRLEEMEPTYLEQNAEERDELLALSRKLTDLFKSLRKPRGNSGAARREEELAQEEAVMGWTPPDGIDVPRWWC
jgi:ParB family transcriptional regulator, chromosome partitioning protein